MNETLLVGVLGLFGAALGFGADYLAHRWPDHEDPAADHEDPAADDDLAPYSRTGVDWRTVVVTATGALAFGALAARWSADPVAIVIYGLSFAALLVLLATDLDQKLLPDVITLPLIGFSAVVLVLGWSPALAGKELGLASGVAAGIGAPVLLLVSDRLLGGDLGLGDVKLSVSLGLMFGISLLLFGLLIASLGFAVVLLVLIGLRRIGLRSAVPFGPVLIFGAFIAALLG